MLRSGSRFQAKLNPLAPLSRTRRTLATVAPPLTREPTELNYVTKLSNGLRVATDALPDAFSGVGVYIDAGSRYETDYLRGASHLMDRLAFKSTSKHTADEVLEQVELLGGSVQCASSRESMMYQAATFNKALPAVVGLLAETIRDALLTEDEVRQQVLTAEYEVAEIVTKPDLMIPELIHTAAFKDNTLGNPLLCPQERLTAINKHVIDSYRDALYRPERMVVAFAGVPHSEAVKLAEKHFGDMKGAELPVISETGSEKSIEIEKSSPSFQSSTASLHPISPTPPQQTLNLLAKIPFLKNLSTSASHNASILSTPRIPISSDDLHRPAHYTGGFLSIPPQLPSSNPMTPAFTHIHLAFEGLPISSEDIYALATLQILLGGGGSFSAGGPGKGMYSRLYTNILNQYGWVESCMAFNHSYTDSGLFGIAASCCPGQTATMLEVMCRQLHALTLDTGFSQLNELEVSRAKTQLRSSLLMNLESRMVGLEDLGRQVQVHGRRVPIREMTRKIGALRTQDLKRVARMVFGGLVENPGKGSGAPTVVLQEAQESGANSRTMSWDEIQDMIFQSQLGRR